ncbi:late competence protein ComER [bacterium LRH843]|nr:late competence protein ComER [bacterium LRH843]
MKIGIVGTGSMGTILIESFIDSGAVTEKQLLITNRTIEKAQKLKDRFPKVELKENLVSIAKEADILFLCMKPLQIPDVLRQLKPIYPANKLLISITSPISIEQLETMVDCKVARVIPSILNRALTGSSLVSFGKRCSDHDRKKIMDLISSISEPLLIEENITRVSSDIVSCGPAFFSYLIQRFIDAAVRQTKITKEDATTLATNMMIGMGKLLEEGHYTLPTLQQRVSVPGGITGEGIKVLEIEIGEMFDHLFQSTIKKYEEDKFLIANAFEKNE